MTSHTIIGGGGVKLHVVEAGDPKGRPIVYIHGFSQCWLAWSCQLNSDLAQDYRLVAMDLRGHGLSDKPVEGYDDPKMWAADVDAVIATLGLDQPVLCGWSYGGLVILDYMRHFGTENIGGVHFVDAITKTGSDDAAAVISQEFLALIPGFFSTDVTETVRSLDALLRMCCVRPPTDEQMFLMLGYNVAVPPYVRQALFSRTLSNDDLLPNIRKPVLITHGVLDAAVKPLAADQHKTAIPHAELHLMQNAGHAPFWDDAPSFNARQRRSVRALP